MTSKETANESILVAACLKGDKAAQHQFYLKYSPMLFAICKRYAHDEDLAKDMFQEAMIKIFQKLADFRFEGSFEGWMKRVCVNQCLDILKKSKAKFNDSLSDDHLDLPSSTDIISDIHAKNLMSLLSKLPVGYRTVFNLFAIEGYSHAEIAGMLNISENTSKSQMFKARKWLQNQIGQ
jgi:RNA polymerase sigma-70 factor (ECF subfamily)